ncbi:MAG TPA: Ig-like domain-containing protein [Microbacteriaceae bacterium]|nr:Ig-like domain-containing protein [Microbacteriaceae bacterium]HRA09635.1 Ig-like domain-containing protein [Microbacteriaceae bacterium]
MGVFAQVRRKRSALVGASILTVSAVAITTMALAYDGYPTVEADLNDGGVWLTKTSSLLVGHFNHQSAVLDGGLRTKGDDYDIAQAGRTVLVVDGSNATVTAVDPAQVKLLGSANIPGGASVSLGADTVAILEPKDGALWVTDVDSIESFNAAAIDPITTLGKGAVATVGTDGTVYAASPEQRELVEVAMSPQREPLDPTRSGLDIAEGAALAISAIGDRAIVLDHDTQRVIVRGGGTTQLEDAAGARLQQPSDSAANVAIATADALVQIPVGGGDPISTPSGGAVGVPAQPVQLTGCTYAAWSGSNRFVRDCLLDAQDAATDIDRADENAEFMFRVNRKIVVLNDTFGGTAWMASENMQRVDNWNDITPPEGDEEDEENTAEEFTETTLPERTDINTTPVAADDDFGVRAGRTTIISVIDNDSDPDGDVLTATLPSGSPGIGTVEPIYGGTALQISVPDDATGRDAFIYRVDDGRGGWDEATVRISVSEAGTNQSPVQKRAAAVTVEQSGSVSYNVLPDWLDPDGDDLFLKAASVPDGDEVEFTADGQITFRATSQVQGRKEIAIVVSDGTGDTEGVLRVDVRPIGSTKPVTNADHVQTRVGQTVTVSPLVNDVSPSGVPLRLARLDEVAGAKIVPDYTTGTFSFQAEARGTYYAQYLVTDGPNTVVGIVRIDVEEALAEDLPPIAVRDVAMLPGGSEVLVDVLANDSDPGGGILVVQSVTVPQGAGISVAVLNHEVLRIADQGGLVEPVTIGYRVSNGTKTADGEVIVIPVPAPNKLKPPVATDDSVVVRAGDIVTIPVLANDYHPNGDLIKVSPTLIDPIIDPADGDVFVSENTLRFRAGETPKTVYATYEVVDSAGQKDAGYVTIQILGVDEETNAAPRPRDLTARVLSGSIVRIPIPLDGIDTDGDSVELIGAASAPAKGRIIEVGQSWLVYEAYENSTGVDSFTYLVRDRLGKEGVAPVRVGIAPPEADNQRPYAVNDSVILRPSRSAAVAVLANDSDPDGDRIDLDPKGLEVPEGLTAEVKSNQIIVQTPAEPGEYTIPYRITDARGASAIGALLVLVQNDVPLQPPLARDDRVTAEQVGEEATVDVIVLDNDVDPDGVAAELKVALVGTTTAKVLPGGLVRVTVAEASQIITYTVTDVDGLTASAFVLVPGSKDLRPVLRSTDEVVVQSGETIELRLADYVTVAGGGKAVITEAAKATANHSNGASLVKDQSTLVYTSADRYFGKDAITFEVTDGTGPDDPEGRKAVLTIPVTVLPPKNQSPTFADSTLDVAPGESATDLDLRASATDPDEGDLKKLTFRMIGGAPSGFSVSVDGSTLKASAEAKTPKGTVGSVTIEVSDGESEPVRGTVDVRVTASIRPLAAANDDVILEAHQGKEATVKVLANDYNPFPDTPLKVLLAEVEAGEGTAKVVGETVIVTPGPDYFGTMIVRYRVSDATSDNTREVDGRIRLTVQGRPDTPGVPTVTSVQDRLVVMSWTPPSNNGAEITHYEVTSLTPAGYKKTCASTTCTLNGLTNNVEYTFQVIAVNRVGSSDPSLPSAVARPDARPDTPQPPTLVFGDRALDVRWITPPTPGSPVESFTLEISPAPPSGSIQKTGVTGNTLRWEGLENGTAYQVRVRAHNRAPEPSSWSGYSSTMIPAAPPEAPGAPTTARLDPVGPQAQLQVSWGEPANNGDAVSKYTLYVMQGGAIKSTINNIPASTRSQAVVIAASTTDYTFTVAATNKAGTGSTSPPSSPRRAFTQPGMPATISATEGNNTVGVNFGAAAGNGANAGEIRYEYSVGSGNWRSDWVSQSGTSGTIGNGQVNNNGSYSIRVRAYTEMDGVRYNGDPSPASNTVAPYGPIGKPTVTAVQAGQTVKFTWTAPARNGRDFTVKTSVNGGTLTTAVPSGSMTVGNGYSQTHSIRVVVTDAAGQTSEDTKSAVTMTAPPPPASASISRGASGGCGGCNYYQLNVSNFTPGNYTLTCLTGGSMMQDTWPQTFWVPANGPVQLHCWYGFPGRPVSIKIDGWGTTPEVPW